MVDMQAVWVWRKRPIEIEAVQWTGENTSYVLTWLAERGKTFTYLGQSTPSAQMAHTPPSLVIPTSHGDASVQLMDFLMIGPLEELQVMRPGVFGAIHDPVRPVE